MRDPATVSRVMARIRKVDTGPELTLRRALWRKGLRGYRLYRRVPGQPDVSFGVERLAVFVDGCFWHRCPRCDIKVPSKPYWKRKLEGNQARDRRVNELLRERGWAVLRLWEHELRNDLSDCVFRVEEALKRLRKTTPLC
jgi:DNA mismatch endonuclease (patch repair protein)